jgi:serine/threonine protein kinase
VFVTSVPGTSEKQAIKLIHHSLMPRARLDNECIIHGLLKHPYVMPLTESFDYQEFRAMLMPRATGGSLLDITSANPITLGKIIYRLFKGIHYLHSLHILHGDLKPSNVLLMRPDWDEPHPVVIDFGHSANLCCIDSCDCKLMTYTFSSPELLALKPHSLPSDIWSLGATVYFLLTRQDLLRGANLEALRQSALRLQLSFDAAVWNEFPVSIRALLHGMLRSEPEKRFTIAECIAHQFFADLLGSDWVHKENENVKFLSKRRLTEELIEVKRAFHDQNHRHKQ